MGVPSAASSAACSVFPDFRNTVEEMVAEGDKVAARLTYRGTHRGEILGVAATGRRVRYSGMALFSFQAGRIRDAGVLGDRLELLQALGG